MVGTRLYQQNVLLKNEFFQIYVKFQTICVLSKKIIYNEFFKIHWLFDYRRTGEYSISL